MKLIRALHYWGNRFFVNPFRKSAALGSSQMLYSRLVGCVLLTGMATFANAQSFLRTSGQQIIDQQGRNVLLRGVGLGGWMLQEGYMLRIYNQGQQYKIRERIRNLIGEPATAAFYESWLANHTTRADIDSLKAWGFNSVRLPMHYNLYTLPVEQEPVAGQQTWLDKGFALTDSLLAWCKANGLYLILDLHAAPGGQGNDLNISDRDPDKPSLWDSEANKQKTIALWRKLAARYASEPAIGAYDILNEPNWGFADPSGDRNGLQEKNNGPLKQLLVDITKAIREVDPRHIIIIEGNGWGNNYNGMLPPWDSNMVLSFHKYWNYNDVASIRHILQFREQYNVPVWLGETGENSNVWFTECIRLLEQHNIGWAWWPLKKLGANNPLQIPAREEYKQLLEYWEKPDTVKPAAAKAEEVLMALAKATNISENIIHYDVIDAMIRQPHEPTAKPFRPHQLTGNYLLPAVDYDLGPNGIAYFDMDTANYHIANGGKRSEGNRGHMYRNDGVDIFVAVGSKVRGAEVINGDTAAAEAALVAAGLRDNTGFTGQTGKDFFVDDIETGEWLQYTIDVQRAGNYRLELLAGAGSKTGEVQLSLDGKPVGTAVSIPAITAQQWQPVVVVNKLSLKAGRHVLRLHAVKGGDYGVYALRFSR
ncbi:MAG: cellulase family glycosylhydrolase [Candidatus Pseudobacter hemicellulosilyticus]|uniref:Cellulase family glycosylhydrolase n=1 Tax=Candidatus Pseudobacter hemicellulosilyticus TaxID=3121375 RepID=A0AAJ5WU94_9BACT|nr:MAG: cellulase family glycosylhydrolase [Pseudobacter sp.]